MDTSYQVILEIRYNQILNFSNKAFIQELSDHLGSLGYLVSFFNNIMDATNPNTREHISIGENRCGFDFSTKGLDYNNFKKNIDQLTSISSLIKFNFLTRIGLRVTAPHPYLKLSDSTKKITSLLTIKNVHLEDIKSNCDVCTLSFGIKKEETNINLTIVPNQINVSLMGIEQQINTLNLDIDVFEMNLNFSPNSLEKKYRTFLNEIRTYNLNLNEIFE